MNNLFLLVLLLCCCCCFCLATESFHSWRPEYKIIERGPRDDNLMTMRI